MKAFNIRVYGLYISNGHVLVVREEHKGLNLVKFPGGGLKFGEGLKECILREWKEETGLLPIDANHFYTNEEFVQSAFNPDHQIISVYYTLDCDLQYPVLPNSPENISFEWVNLKSTSGVFTFNLDRIMAKRLAK